MYTVNFPTIIHNTDGFHVASCILLHICLINFSYILKSLIQDYTYCAIF